MQYGISFDFWNTLYGNGEEERRYQLRFQYFQDFLSGYGNIDREMIRNAFQESTRMFMDHWIRKQRTPRPTERVRFMCDLIGVKIDHSSIKKIAEYFGHIIDIVPPLKIPAIHDVIVRLANEYSLAIISDTGYISGNHIRTFLEKEKLLPCFQSHFFSDEHDHCKPHPSVFKLTCHNLHVDCEGLIHIGDLEHTDVRGIKDIGGISIKFTGCNDSATNDSLADYVIDTYTDLIPVIEKITGAKNV